MAQRYLTAEAIRAHDLQRRLTPGAQAALVAGFRERLACAGQCLDAGTGTGDTALLLAQAGLPIFGLDISRAMLRVLATRLGGRASFPLVQGDLVRLPFADASFGGARVAHVFHLIEDWRVAVAELVRVVRPGGLLLVNPGGSDHSEIGTGLRRQFETFLGERIAPAAAADLRGPSDFDACLVGHGADILPPLSVRDQQIQTIGQMIERLDHNVFAWPGGVERQRLAQAVAATRAWATAQVGSLDQAVAINRIITY